MEIATDSREADRKALEVSYTKEQMLSSKRYRHRKDLIQSLLEDGCEYHLRDIERYIENFMTANHQTWSGDETIMIYER